MRMVKYMSSRMDKYKDEERVTESRTARNQKIYGELNEKDFEDINLTSNISVINTDTENLDIDTLKEILNEKYKKESKKIQRPKEKIVEEKDFIDEEHEDTKEYDLKKVIETAHKNKTSDYDEERFKKIRETQYDILNSLNINKGDNDDNIENEKNLEENLTVEEANLMTLIKTVNENASKKKKPKPIEDDLLSDLKGDESKTEVLDPIPIEETEPDKKPTLVEELEKTKQLSRKEIDDEIDKLTTKLDDVIEKVKEEVDKEEDNEDEKQLSKTAELTNSFYTGKFQINKNDMDDFKDLEDELSGGSIFIKILIILLVLIIIAVAVYFLNKYLNLGLF